MLAIENQLLLSSCLLAAAVVLGTRRPVLAGASAASGGCYLLSLALFLRGRGWRPVGPLLFGFLRREVPLSRGHSFCGDEDAEAPDFYALCVCGAAVEVPFWAQFSTATRTLKRSVLRAVCVRVAVVKSRFGHSFVAATRTTGALCFARCVRLCGCDLSPVLGTVCLRQRGRRRALFCALCASVLLWLESRFGHSFLTATRTPERLFVTRGRCLCCGVV